MTLMRYLPLTLLLPLLSACEPKVEPAKVAAEKPASSAAVPSVVAPPPAVQAPAAAKAPPAKPRPPAAAAGARPKAAQAEGGEADQAQARTKLDLSLPPELAEQLRAEDRGTETALAPLLPPLFEPKRSAVNPFQLSGRLLTNDGDEDYWNSVDGAELQFEFKR